MLDRGRSSCCLRHATVLLRRPSADCQDGAGAPLTDGGANSVPVWFSILHAQSSQTKVTCPGCKFTNNNVCRLPEPQGSPSVHSCQAGFNYPASDIRLSSWDNVVLGEPAKRGDNQADLEMHSADTGNRQTSRCTLQILAIILSDEA